MSDRELLELAAKAAGIELRPRFGSAVFTHDIGGNHWHVWNPLTDDGDAFRLMVFLMTTQEVAVLDYNADFEVREVCGIDPVEAAAQVRRAITRAAAEIGRNLT